MTRKEVFHFVNWEIAVDNPHEKDHDKKQQ